MAIVEESYKTPVSQNPSPGKLLSQTSSSRPKDDPPPSPAKKPASPKEAIVAVAAAIAAQRLPCSDSDVWGVLTAISNNARKRSQGINFLLTADEHCVGRIADDVRFQIESTAVSQRHCAIFRKKFPKEDVENPSGFCKRAFIKDTSTNGTYLNWERLKRGSSKFEALLHHGDIVSFAAPPQHEQAFAFVYREVLTSVPSSDAFILKRKADECSAENKRHKGIGIGAPEGPISLDDFRSLQRSNSDLRKQLENHVHTIESLQNENRAALERHEIEIKEVKESMSKSYLDQMSDLSATLDGTKEELMEANKTAAEHKHAIEDLNERLSAALQSCTEANDIMKSQKASIAELKSQLDEERDQRREEREKAAADLKTSIAKVQSEAEEALKRFSDDASKREREQQEVINKLQESERESSSLVESLRSKLEETRQKLVHSDNRVRQLEAQVLEEQQASSCRRRRVEDLETEMKKIRRELEKEKQEAREEAWAKVSALELEISAAMRDLESERQRLKGARERILLRETQLRAFYSTTEAIQLFFFKQQEQLKAMQRTLEDEENYDNGSLDGLLDAHGNADRNLAGGKEATGYKSNSTAKAGPSSSAQRFDQGGVVAETSSEEGSATQKHDCDIRIQNDEDTQEAEFPNDVGLLKCGFGSDIDGVGTAPICEGDADGTERVPETESPCIDGERNLDSDKPGTLAGDTMQLEFDTNVQETEQKVPSREEAVNAVEDTGPGGDIRTQDLLASEVAGSWACSTAPSVYGENESPHGEGESSGNHEVEHHAHLNDSNTQVAESQSSPAGGVGTRMHPDHERQALSRMIGIMAPDVKDQFRSEIGNDSQDKNAKVSDSDSETDDECVEASKDVEADGGSGTDDETQAVDQADKNEDEEDGMEVDDDDTQEDSVG